MGMSHSSPLTLNRSADSPCWLAATTPPLPLPLSGSRPAARAPRRSCLRRRSWSARLRHRSYFLAAGADFASRTPQNCAGELHGLLWSPRIKLSVWVSDSRSSREQLEPAAHAVNVQWFGFLKGVLSLFRVVHCFGIRSKPSIGSDRKGSFLWLISWEQDHQRW